MVESDCSPKGIIKKIFRREYGVSSQTVFLCGTRCRVVLRHYAASWNVEGSRSDEMKEFNKFTYCFRPWGLFSS
jgi:hypothetical protein